MVKHKSWGMRPPSAPSLFIQDYSPIVLKPFSLDFSLQPPEIKDQSGQARIKRET